ncbi:hypothetical protein J5N97_014277 [Dioscorea zingiberensis]|uniref:Uncharacterized protein n=1 Tax=Dioscorea zingiberensis TaxID=325984 RepID=A0A9D5CUT5_9LILI|nr:hypothetical protein J5N97_014277 [Dioscorea zingiberensis]
MSEPCRVSFRDGRLASRKAEEAVFSRKQRTLTKAALGVVACRRFLASRWLEDMAGPLDLPPDPSEQEFVACLRSGLVLCTVVNKIQPGAVPKVVTIHSLGTSNDIQPLPAYQYFENVRNFLVAVNELKLPSFEASDLEKDTVEKGSATKIVDCILGLKSYYEWKQCNGGSGPWKLVKSPLVAHSVGRTQSNAISPGSSISCRKLDLSATSDKQNVTQNENLISKDVGIALSKLLSNCLLDSKENIDHKLLDLQNASQELRSLLLMTRMEFVTLRTQLQNDLTLLGTYLQGISAAAIGYNQAVRENKHLYNMIQELRGNIRVFCRIRPAFNMEAKSSIDYTGKDGSLIVVDPTNPQSTRKSFHFNKIFGPDASQDEVYKDTQPLIRSVMDGYNVCIFAYGQTGSGKTHTMCGPSSGLSKNVGVNYMALSDLFQISSAREGINTLEIKNCSANGGLNVPDASMRSVQSVDDVLTLMKLGEKNRIFCSTAMNNRSSRSHSVLTVHILGEDMTRCKIRSCLHLVDLAGSERVDKSEVTGDRLKEAQHINKSLSCLGDVITALAQKNSHIPYRNSKLTQLLQNSLGGRAKVLMFAHVSPEADSYGETLSTLKFAQRVSTVELGAAHLNKESSEVLELKEEIESLKKALSRKEVEKPVPSYKMKENRPILEMQNHNVRTPPRSRRLSIESVTVQMVGSKKNPTDTEVHRSLSQIVHTPTLSIRSSMDGNGVLKIASMTKADEVFSKSPTQRPKIGAEHAPVRIRRLSIEGIKCLKPHSDIPKDGILSSVVSCEGVSVLDHLNKETFNEVDCGNVCDTYPGPISPSRSLCPRNVNMSTSSPLQPPKSPLSMRKLDEMVTPHDGGLRKMSQATKTSITNPSTKGSQIRKSLQTIGKFISGSEKGNSRYPTETPASIFGRNNRNNRSDDKSPMTIDARLRRRQSLTPVQTSVINMSRRSSLGGKSPELCK